MDTSTESLLILASAASRLCGDEEGPLLAGAAQAVPATLLPTVCLPPQLPARRLPLPATASLRCGLSVQDPAKSRPCREEGTRCGGTLALALTGRVDLLRPHGRELLQK